MDLCIIFLQKKKNKTKIEKKKYCLYGAFWKRDFFFNKLKKKTEKMCADKYDMIYKCFLGFENEESGRISERI